MRRFVPLVLLLSLAACRTYDRYPYVSSGKGLMPPDEYAKYGPEQAIAVAVGREFGKDFAGKTDADYAKQADAAMAYSKKFPQIKSITADTLGHRLVVTFQGGWTTQVSPIADGKGGDETAGLPKK
jgi:hypothetical protein